MCSPNLFHPIPVTWTNPDNLKIDPFHLGHKTEKIYNISNFLFQNSKNYSSSHFHTKEQQGSLPTQIFTWNHRKETVAVGCVSVCAPGRPCARRCNRAPDTSWLWVGERLAARNAKRMPWRTKNGHGPHYCTRTRRQAGWRRSGKSEFRLGLVGNLIMEEEAAALGKQRIAYTVFFMPS